MFNLDLIINGRRNSCCCPALAGGFVRGRGGSGGTGEAISSFGPEWVPGWAEGQRGQGPAAYGVVLLSPPVPISPWGQGRLQRAGTCYKDLRAGVRCPSRTQVAENALRPTGHDEKTGFLGH